MVFSPPSRYFPLVSGSSTNLPRSRGTEIPKGEEDEQLEFTAFSFFICQPTVTDCLSPKKKNQENTFKGFHFFEMVVL